MRTAWCEGPYPLFVMRGRNGKKLNRLTLILLRCKLILLIYLYLGGHFFGKLKLGEKEGEWNDAKE